MTGLHGLAIRRLARLPTHRISPGEPDIRSWLVIDAEGRRLGRVRDLLIDIPSLRTRYVDVALDPHVAALAASSTAVLPVECLRVAAVRPYVHLLGVSTSDFVNVPELGTAPIGSDAELHLRRFFRCQDRTMGAEDFWRPRRGDRASQPYVSSTNIS